MDLEKAYDRVLREELCLCIRESGVAEKYFRPVQDMYGSSTTVVWCTVGVADSFKVEMGQLQEMALRPFLFALV